MKKIYLLSILMCIGSWGYAQTITLTYKDVSLTDQQNIYVDSVDENFGYMKVEIGVRNESDKDITVNVMKKPISILDNSNNLFCWGANCYSSSVLTSQNAVTIPAKAINYTFYAEYMPAFSLGKSIIEYSFFDVRNNLNKSSVIVHFVEKDDTRINDLKDEEYVHLYPSNINRSISISTNLNKASKLFIYNLQGQRIMNYSLAAGNIKINLPLQLEKGIYFFVIERSNSIVFQEKFICY